MKVRTDQSCGCFYGRFDVTTGYRSARIRFAGLKIRPRMVIQGKKQFFNCNPRPRIKLSYEVRRIDCRYHNRRLRSKHTSEENELNNPQGATARIVALAKMYG